MIPTETILSPAYDNKIARKFSLKTLEHKMQNKLALQEELGWIAEPKQPIICLPAGMTDELGGKLMEEVVPGVLELSVGLVIRGKGSSRYGQMFTDLSKKMGFKVKIVGDTDLSQRKMLAGSDMALLFSAPDGNAEVENALRYGVIPIALPGLLLENYNPVQESGNAFVYEEATKWQCFAALVRALETFKFPYDWRTIQRHAMESVEKSEEQ